jgi:hypothetical protein
VVVSTNLVANINKQNIFVSNKTPDKIFTNKSRIQILDQCSIQTVRTLNGPDFGQPINIQTGLRRLTPTQKKPV